MVITDHTPQPLVHTPVRMHALTSRGGIDMLWLGATLWSLFVLPGGALPGAPFIATVTVGLAGAEGVG